MKSSAVNLAANIFANGVDNLPKGAVAAEENTVFASFMNRASQEQNVSVETEVKATEEPEMTRQQAEEPDEVQEAQEVDEVKDTEETSEQVEETETEEVKVAEEIASENVLEDGQELPQEMFVLFENFVQEIQNLFMEKFQITEEDFVNLMESMNINAEDLVNPTVLTEMVKALGGAKEDAMALLVNESLYASCKEIIKEVAVLQENLLEQMDITPKELEQMLVKYWEQHKPVPEENVSEGLVDVVEEVLHFSETSNERVEVQTVSKEEKEFPGEMDVKTENVNEDNNIIAKEISVNTENAEEKGSRQEFNGQSNQEFADFVNQLKENVNMNVQTAGTDFLASEVDYESIVRQISEQIRIHVSEDVSSMEMQMNPENLGKVEMHLVLKQGTLTAQFSVENEQVKEAMESQIAQLREDFDKQGLKVEAIEVTVESHEFEQNLMQGEENGNQAQQEGTKTNRAIRFGLEELAEETDFLSDEELAEKMMKEDGTTLNYLA